jgi:hypothetical protein
VDAESVRAVTGSRVQLLCVDASPRFVVFGSNIGSVYVFERVGARGRAKASRRSDDATSDETHPDAALDRTERAPNDRTERSVRFLERFMVETRDWVSASLPVVIRKRTPQTNRAASAFEGGDVATSTPARSETGADAENRAENEKQEWWMFGVRPGRRLWVCHATIRPSVPEAKREFGSLHSAGPRLLSCLEKTIAAVDIPSATVLAWYHALDFRNASEHTGSGFSLKALGTFGVRTFALGADGAERCVRAPASERRLAEALVASKVASPAIAETALDDVAVAAHLERIERRLRAVQSSVSAFEAPSATEATPPLIEPPREDDAETASPTDPASTEEPAKPKETHAFGWITRARNPRSFGSTTPAATTTAATIARQRNTTSPFASSAEIPENVSAIDRPTDPFSVSVNGIVIDVVDVDVRSRQISAASIFHVVDQSAAASRIVPDDEAEHERSHGVETRAPPAELDETASTPNAVFRSRGFPVAREARAREDEEDALAVVAASAGDERATALVAASETSAPPADKSESPTSRRQADSPDANLGKPPCSPRVDATNQMFVADLSPWWMRLVELVGCGPVRPNKREKNGFGVNWLH